MDARKWGIVYCPKSGSFRPQKRWERIEKILKQLSVDYDFVQSEQSSSVDRLVTMLINNGYKTIVIVGGDSALNDAVNCLMSAGTQTREGIKLGVIPNGKMNDFAHFWDIKENDVEGTVRMLKNGRTRKIDLGCIRYTNSNGEKCHRYFHNSLNIGLVASVMNMRRKTTGWMGMNTVSIIPASLKMVFQRLEYKMHLKINDDTIKRKIMSVSIGNAQGYGFTPNAVPYNGWLDVSVVYHPEVTQLFEGFYLLYSGKILNHRDVHPYRTKAVEVMKAERAHIGIDGRLMNTPVGPFHVEVEQEVVSFIIP